MDDKSHTLGLTQFSDKKWKGSLQFDRKSPEHLILDGNMGSQKVRLELTRFDVRQFTLVKRGFHWVQEYPFNR